MRSVRKLFRGIFSVRHHFIMKINFNNIKCDEDDRFLYLSEVNQLSDLINGTYSIGLQSKLINENKGLCSTFLLKDTTTNDTIGILSVMYKGGDELEYKIRNIDVFIYNVMIDKKYRGRGYVGIMIRLLGKQMKKKSITEAFLAVSINNRTAIKAYQTVGFKTISEKWFVRMLKRNIPYHSL